MSTILEMTSDLVSAHASTTPMTSDELILEIKKVYASLLALEAVEAVEVIEDIKPAISVKEVSFFRTIHPPEPLIFQEHSPTPFSRAFTHLGNTCGVWFNF